MADRYQNFVMNPNPNPKPGDKPALRPLFTEKGCTNINKFSKNDLIELAVEYDARNAPLFLDSPETELKASEEQKNALIEAVNARKKAMEDGEKAETAKRGKGKKGGKKAKATTVRPGKGKAKIEEEDATSSDAEAVEQDQDGDIHMVEDEDAAEAASIVNTIADAVSSPHGGKRKRTTTTLAADKRVRTARSKSTKPLLIVKLKTTKDLPGTTKTGIGRMENTIQVSGTDGKSVLAGACDETDEAQKASGEDFASSVPDSRDTEQATYMPVPQRTPGSTMTGHMQAVNIHASNHKVVCYLKEETEEEEAFYPYNLLSGPGRLRRLEAQEKRKIKQAKDNGELYVPEPVKEPYDWTKHMEHM